MKEICPALFKDGVFLKECSYEEAKMCYWKCGLNASGKWFALATTSNIYLIASKIQNEDICVHSDMITLSLTDQYEFQ